MWFTLPPFLSLFSTGTQSAATCSRWFHARGFFYPEDGGDTFFRKVGSHKKYTAPHPRKHHSSSLPLLLYSLVAVETCLFAQPLLSNGYYTSIVAYFAVVA
jgi:hypothetical protein